ncbi:MAG: ABC transporter ATP-binding protein [Acidobacteriota bacterium]|nr:ABC transporter ATP-binding protein [Acidobacteriota bacterium]MDE2922697.1 ABC transporter ATP-binding protein [Acidobacteriota bacterium]MDE3265653.1 ABC transporter ATP-binding protein [Acidobacteriota bacterium]
MIAVAGVTKAYQDGAVRRQVLRGVDLEVARGDTAAIVGPSGSGKSTLLNILGALDAPDAGSVRVDGVDLTASRPSALAGFRNRSLGFVFQFHQLLPDFTALENVMMPGRIAGRPTSPLSVQALTLLDQVDLADRAGAFPQQLSGGERQRIAICRALVLEPAVLLADEPTGNLDSRSGEQVLELLDTLRRRRDTTMVLVTHNPEVAKRCGKVLCLDGGRLTALGE